MRISRLYTHQTLNLGQQIKLVEENAHYVRNVLRLKKDQLITLFNGQGGDFLCTLTEVNRNRVLVNINEFNNRTVESPLKIILGLGISRGDKMDWAVQKTVELGVNKITPLITDRCIIKFRGDKKQQRQHHWKNIVQHATEQCGRTLLPELNEIEALSVWIKKQTGLKVFLDPHAEKSLKELSPNDMQITFLSGPEGGFSHQERELAVAAGFIPIRLGHRILRTETASLAAISAVQMLWGDFT